MVESIFQTLLLLAYFNIALLSITIANYAVSASYLGRESRLSRWRMERRKQKLLEKLKELRETTQIDSIKKEIGEAEEEQRGLGLGIFLLSWLGAVILPSMFFVISFVCSVFGMNAEILSQDLETQRFLEQQLVIFSSGTLATGFMVLLFVIRTIDSSAKKIPIPEFEVKFENLTDTITLKRNKNAEILLRMKNKGEDIAERIEIFVTFPNVFKIKEMEHYDVHETGPQEKYPSCVQVRLTKNSLHIDTFLFFYVSLTAPDVKKNYEIVVEVCEKKTGMSKSKLFIEVVD
jgi:hypothetical protein